MWSSTRQTKSMENAQPVVPVTLTVVLDTQTVVLKKIPLKRYDELLGSLELLPKKFNAFGDKTEDEMFNSLPKIVLEAKPEVEKIISIATPLTPEQIGELALDESVKLLVGVVTVNRYTSIWGELKKVFAQPTTPENTPV
jgi:hypothetical protein